MKKHQKQIRDTYRSLGDKYIEDIQGIKVKEMDEFIKLIPSDSKVLDVGCAGGRDSAIFIKNNLSVVGIDLVDEFIKIAKKNVPKGKFYAMDLLNIKLPRNYFGAVWTNAVLLHIEKKDISKVLKSLYLVLKPGGVIHIRVKRGRDSKMIIDKLSQKTSRNFTLFFKYEMEEYVKNAGFKIIISKLYPDEAKRKNLKWIGIWAIKQKKIII